MSQFDMRNLIAENKQKSATIIDLMEKNERYKNLLKEWGDKIVATIKDGDLARLHNLKYPEDLTQ